MPLPFCIVLHYPEWGLCFSNLYYSLRLNTLRRMLLSTIDRLTLTHANVDYEGSITIPTHLLEATAMLPGETVWVWVWDVTNGRKHRKTVSR